MIDWNVLRKKEKRERWRGEEEKERENEIVRKRERHGDKWWLEHKRNVPNKKASILFNYLIQILKLQMVIMLLVVCLLMREREIEIER